MADEELPPVEGDAEVLGAPVTDDTPDPIAALASEMGWTPKETWRGDPDKWRPADEFIRKGHEINRTQNSDLRSLREETGRLARVSTQLLEDKLAERDAHWKAQIAQATEEGDTERVLRLSESRPQAQQPSAPPAEAAAWVAKNAWFNTDPLAQSLAKETTDRLAKQGFSVADQLEAAERAVKREYPEHFPAPAKAPPATQTGQNRNPSPSNRARGFADMPAESQSMAMEFERRNGVKREDFAKSYWADASKGKVG